MLAHREELEQFLHANSVEEGEYCVTDDAVLALYGVRLNSNIAVCLNSSARSRFTSAIKARAVEHLAKVSENVEVVSNPFAALGIGDAELFGGGQYTRRIDGIQSARLELVLLSKFAGLNDRTLSDIRLIEASINRLGTGWDWELVTQLARSLQQQRASRPVPNIAQRAVARLGRVVREPTRIVRVAKRIVDKGPKPGPSLVPHLGWIPTRTLLSLQYDSGVFQRVDVAALIMAAESRALDPSGARRLFEMLARPGNGSSHRWNEFAALLDSMSAKGFNPRHPLIVDSQGLTVNGVQRLAAALHVGVSHVPVNVVRSSSSEGRDLSWLSRAGFREEEIAQVATRVDKLLCDEGVYFPIVLWPPARHLYDDIQSVVSQFGRIVRVAESTLPWPQFLRFVHKVYRTDDYHQWQIEVKVHAMKHLADEYTLRVLWLEFPHPDYRPHVLGGPALATAALRLKRAIRNDFASRIDGYVGDVMIHMGDFANENADITRAFREWRDSKLIPTTPS